MTDFWDRLAPAWESWHAAHATLTAPVTEALIGAAGVLPGQRVLDLASGVGDPALALAARVGDSGAVVGTDSSGAMLEAAARLAQAAGRGNVTWQPVGDGPLPFGDGEFGAVTCRFGLMFLPPDTLREARRVLRPGGRLALAAWADPTQPYFDEFDGVVARHFGWPPPRAGEPGLFQYADPERLRADLTGAGFRGVRAEVRRVDLFWPGTADDYVACRLAFAPQVAGLLAALPPGERTALGEAWRQGARRRVTRDGLLFGGAFVLASGAC